MWQRNSLERACGFGVTLLWVSCIAVVTRDARADRFLLLGGAAYSPHFIPAASIPGFPEKHQAKLSVVKVDGTAYASESEWPLTLTITPAPPQGTGLEAKAHGDRIPGPAGYVTLTPARKGECKILFRFFKSIKEAQQPGGQTEERRLLTQNRFVVGEVEIRDGDDDGNPPPTAIPVAKTQRYKAVVVMSQGCSYPVAGSDFAWAEDPASGKIQLAGANSQTVRVTTGSAPSAGATDPGNEQISVVFTPQGGPFPCAPVKHRLTVVKPYIKARDGSAPPQVICAGNPQNYKAVVSPSDFPVADADFSWAEGPPSAKISLADQNKQVVTVIAGADPSEDGGLEGIKVLFTPQGSGQPCDWVLHGLKIAKVDVQGVAPSPYLPGTDDPGDASSMGENVVVTYKISPAGCVLDSAALEVRDKNGTLVHSEGGLPAGGGTHAAVWSVSTNSLRSVSSDWSPYQAKVTVTKNALSCSDQKPLTITPSTVSLEAEPDPSGNPTTECMEGRHLTFTALASGFVSTYPGNHIGFEFHFTRTGTVVYDWSLDLIDDHIARADDVPDGDPDHYFDSPIYARVFDNFGHQATSGTLNVRVYELWIDYFRDASANKEWKVCLGDDIEYRAIASSDCTNWSWDMPEGWPDAWNPTGGNSKQGSSMRIPYTDLARASNSCFGETDGEEPYGKVTVSCEDGEGHNHSFSSTSMAPPRKAKVFFPPYLNVNGGAPSQAAPPCWFVFWNQTPAGDEDIEYDHALVAPTLGAITVSVDNVTRVITSVGPCRIGRDATVPKTLGGNSNVDHGVLNGGVVTGIDTFHFVVTHEKLHESDFTAGIGRPNPDNDCVVSTLEVDNSAPPNGNCTDPGETDPASQNTHAITCPSNDDDDREYRTYYREVNLWHTEVGDYDNVDWSRDGKQW